MAPHDRFDFRNNSTDTVRRIFLEAGFSEHRIGNSGSKTFPSWAG
jgi:hypothetical protein